MPSDYDPIKAALDEALEEFEAKRGADLAARIRPIASANLAAGRLKFFLDRGGEATVHDYLIHLAETYEGIHADIHAIQVERSTEVWEPLYVQMQRLAYNFLLKKGLIPGEVTFQLAVDSATDAALNMLQARFPYDTEFEPWLYQFIKYACLKTIARQVRLVKLVAAEIDPLELAEQLRDPGNGRLDWELFLDLSRALQSLSAKRCQVLMLRYGKGLPSRAIARKMNSTVSAVNKLHHDAIKQLQNLLIEGQENE